MVHNEHDCTRFSVMSTDLVSDAELVERLRRVLKQKGVSQRDLSSTLGVPYRSVQNYLSGDTRIPAVFFIEVCRYIGVEMEYFGRGDFRPDFESLSDAVAAAIKESSVARPPKPEPNPTLVARMTATISERYHQHRVSTLDEPLQARNEVGE